MLATLAGPRLTRPHATHLSPASLPFPPGRQTFRSLPATSSPPVTSIHLVESSPHLREVQKAKLDEFGFGAIRTEWWGSVGEVPPSEDEFTVVVAHEFFDAMPIHVFENTPHGWREVLVDIADPKAIM